MRRCRLVIALISALASPGIAADMVLAIVGGTVVDPQSGASTANATVVIRGGRIAEVGTGLPPPAGAEVLSAAGGWVVPGLIDAHVHFFQSGGLYTRPDGMDLTRLVPYARERESIRAKLDDTFRRYLRCGITAVVDVGGPFWNFEVRERAAKLPDAPRVAVAGPLLSSWQPPRLDGDDPPIIKVDSAEVAIAEVRRQAERKPDLVKIWWIVNHGESPRAFFPIAKAIIDQSHAIGIRVAVHATQLETARAALEAGADVLVHSVDDALVDRAFIELLLQRHAVYVTTLIVHGGYLATFSGQFRPSREEALWADPFVIGTLFDFGHFAVADLPEGIADLMPARPPVRESPFALHNLLTLTRAGATIATGTDAGNIGTLPGPSLHREFAAMARAGLKPIEILRQATSGGAAVFGRDDLDRVSVGAAADLLLLDADPTLDIGNCARIRSIVKEGRVIAPERLCPDGPAEVAQRLLNAMNAADADIFSDLCAEGVAVKDGDQRYGLADLAVFCAARCDGSAHRQLLERTIAGDQVVDHYRLFPKGGGETNRERLSYVIVAGRVRSITVADDGG